MSTARRLTPFLALLAACGLAPAADPLPKPADLLAVYKRLGLPLPPAKARLVRYQSDGEYIINGELHPKKYSLAFELEPATKDDGPLLLQGGQQWRNRAHPELDEAKQTAAAVEGVELKPNDALALAAQCHARGWDDLTAALLERSRSTKVTAVPADRLLALAWEYWVERLSHPTADRTPVVERMKGMMRREPTLDRDEHRGLVRSLELALVPGKGKPGSVEALTDALVDHHRDASEQLADKGFDAVPALIAALTDDRLTRAKTIQFC